ncbi:MAG TPA: NifU family protein [Candidatus Saccharimonadales bacterium]|nr:NifU family protein [Candidatus Saccharimonadales bacterium]
MSTIDNREFQAHAEQIERMVQRVSELTATDARDTALELLQSIMDLHGAVLSRVVEVLNPTEAGRVSLTKLGSDPLICGMLVLYGIHPVSLEGRVRAAIENAAPQLRRYSGSAEFVSVSDSVVRVKLQSSGHGCGSSSEMLKNAIEQAILEAAPDVIEVVVEGIPTPVANGFVPLNLIQPAMKEEKNYEESAA